MEFSTSAFLSSSDPAAKVSYAVDKSRWIKSRSTGKQRAKETIIYLSLHIYMVEVKASRADANDHPPAARMTEPVRLTSAAAQLWDKSLQFSSKALLIGRNNLSGRLDQKSPLNRETRRFQTHKRRGAALIRTSHASPVQIHINISYIPHYLSTRFIIYECDSACHGANPGERLRVYTSFVSLPFR